MAHFSKKNFFNLNFKNVKILVVFEKNFFNLNFKKLKILDDF